MSKGDSTTALLCVLCKVSFPSAWELMVHAQAAHMINIYELGTRPQSPRSAPSPPQSPSQHRKESSPSPQDFQVRHSQVIQISACAENINVFYVLSSRMCFEGLLRSRRGNILPIHVNEGKISENSNTFFLWRDKLSSQFQRQYYLHNQL